MTDRETHDTRRVVDIEAGGVMVVTDLHGDWPLYERYRDVFLHLREQGLARALVFTGDMIHSDGLPEADRSLDIVLDLIELQAALGPDLVVLLGNHEMPHIYHVPLSRGEQVYTPRFERALGSHRETALSFFRSCPFYVRTRAGVTLSHAGAFPEAQDGAAVSKLIGFSHQAVLDAALSGMLPEDRPGLRQAVSKLTGVPYATAAREYLAVETPESPRYDDYLLGILAGFQDDFKLLWSALFSQNEHAVGTKAYRRQAKALLEALSEGYHPQLVLVTGHIGCRNGYRVLAGARHLRIASGSHAHPLRSARYLLFDAGKRIDSAADLLPGLGSLFES
ncbi:MAG: metallophosphoesterase family protein [Anaerolineae bacterium]